MPKIGPPWYGFTVGGQDATWLCWTHHWQSVIVTNVKPRIRTILPFYCLPQCHVAALYRVLICMRIFSLFTGKCSFASGFPGVSSAGFQQFFPGAVRSGLMWIDQPDLPTFWGWSTIQIISYDPSLDGPGWGRFRLRPLIRTKRWRPQQFALSSRILWPWMALWYASSDGTRLPGTWTCLRPTTWARPGDTLLFVWTLLWVLLAVYMNMYQTYKFGVPVHT